MSVQIINLRSNQHYDFNCDVSPVGNPFESERDYERLFDQTMHDATLNDDDIVPLTNITVGEFRNFIQQIVDFHDRVGHVTLACCAPKHCEIIKQWVESPW